MLWIRKEGASWRALPKVYGYWNTIYRCLSRWCDAGVFEETLHEHFHEDTGELSAILVDSRIVRAHSSAAGPRKKRGQDAAALGRSRGGFTTKLHLSLSEDWVPLRSGHRNDITQAPTLIQGYTAKYVIVDKAYDSDTFREAIVSVSGVAVIRLRESRTDPRPYDEDPYKRRNIIERFFHRLKQYRRVATRYDKLSTRYLGFVYFAAILMTTHRM